MFCSGELSLAGVTTLLHCTRVMSFPWMPIIALFGQAVATVLIGLVGTGPDLRLRLCTSSWV